MYNWKKILVSLDTALIDALSVIEKEALRIALIVDENNRLLGTITDGDVRRALIENKNLEIPTHLVMNKNPVTALNTMSPVQIDALLQERNILAIPVVDEGGCVTGLHTLDSMNKSKIKNNPVFIMAGGFGTRLMPLTECCPKPMLKVGGKPILETILEGFIEAGFRNFYFSTHYLPEVIRDHFGDGSAYGCSITYVHEEKPLGTGGALGLLPDNLPDLPIIMMNGDILTKVNYEHLLEDHENKGSIATMCVRQYQYQIPYGVIIEKNGNIIGVDEKPTHSFFVNAGIYVLDPKLTKYVPKNSKIDLPPLLISRVDSGDYVNLFPIHEYWLDIGHPNEFEKAQLDIKEIFYD